MITNPQEKKKTPPLLGCVVFGFITGGLIGLATPLWLVGQMGGPIPFFELSCPITAPSLIITTLIYRARSLRHAVACGFGFSIPITFACSLLPGVFGDRPFRFFSGEMEAFAWLTIPASIVYMMVAFKIRQQHD
jgi:hypothetical protein